MNTDTQWLEEFVNEINDYAILEALLNPNFLPLLESDFSFQDAIQITLNEDLLRESLSLRDRGSLEKEKSIIKAAQAAAISGRGEGGMSVNKPRTQSMIHGRVADRLSQKFGKTITPDQVRDLAKATNALKARGYDPKQAAKMAMNKLRTTGTQKYSRSELNRSTASKPSSPLSTRTGMQPKKKSLLSRALSAFRGGKEADDSYTSKPISGTTGVKGGPSYTAVPKPSSPLHSRPRPSVPSGDQARRDPARMPTPGRMRRPMRRLV